MKTKILFTIIISLVLIGSVTAISINQITKDKFKDKVKELDIKKICDKEKEIKEWKDKKILRIKVGEYQELRCKKDYLEKDWYKTLGKELIKESKELGMVMISNE